MNHITAILYPWTIGIPEIVKIPARVTVGGIGVISNGSISSYSACEMKYRMNADSFSYPMYAPHIVSGRDHRGKTVNIFANLRVVAGIGGSGNQERGNRDFSKDLSDCQGEKLICG